MNNVDGAGLVAASLFALQACFVAVRALTCTRRSEPLRLAGFLFLLAVSTLLLRLPLLHDVLLFPTLWLAGSFLLQAARRTGGAIWTGVSAAFTLGYLIASMLGDAGTVPFAAYRSFCAIVLSAVPLRLLLGLWRGSRSTLLLLTAMCGGLWAAAGAAELVMEALRLPTLGLQTWPLLGIALCTAVLVFEEGYPLRDGWKGRLRGLSGADRFARELHARLRATEGVLAQQDRLVACGVLAVGAAHELKNTLSLIKTTAQFGLEMEDREKKDQALSLLVEHADLGRGSAISLLERISSEGREESRSIDAAKNLANFLRTVKAAFRGEGIVIQTQLAEGIRFRARVSELEQMLLNLVRNSVDACRQREDGGKVITITARQEQGLAVFDVEDEAGGLSADAQENLFLPSASESGSTGLGLYLTRSLAAQNDGSLEYVPTAAGSIFRLVFPVDETYPAAP
jgi:signal transduction histidine kinase